MGMVKKFCFSLVAALAFSCGGAFALGPTPEDNAVTRTDMASAPASVQVDATVDDDAIAFNVAPLALDFGVVAVGTIARRELVAYMETGNGTYARPVISVDEGAFSATSSCDRVVQGPAKCIILVQVAPAAMRQLSGTLLVSYADVTGHRMIRLVPLKVEVVLPGHG